MAPFHACSSVPLRGGSLLLTTKFPDIPGTYFIDLARTLSHPLVLSTRHLDWKSSATRPYFRTILQTIYYPDKRHEGTSFPDKCGLVSTF